MGYRTFDILFDDVKLVTENVSEKWNVSEFQNAEYTIPNSMVEGKSIIRMKYQSPANGTAGGAFYVRLLRQLTTGCIDKPLTDPDNHLVRGSENMIRISGLQENAIVTVYNLTCKRIISVSTDAGDLNISVPSGMNLAYIITDMHYSVTQKAVVN